MTVTHVLPLHDGTLPRRTGVVFVPAAEGSPARLAGHAAPVAVHGLPLPTEQRGRRVAALLAAARGV